MDQQLLDISLPCLGIRHGMRFHFGNVVADIVNQMHIQIFCVLLKGFRKGTSNQIGEAASICPSVDRPYKMERIAHTKWRGSHIQNEGDRTYVVKGLRTQADCRGEEKIWTPLHVPEKSISQFIPVSMQGSYRSRCFGNRVDPTLRH